MAKYLQWVSKNHKIFHLTVLASPGGSLGTDHNIGMPNPLSSTISHKGSICPSEEGDSADIKGWRGECCMSVPTLSWSLLFFAHSCKSKQDPASWGGLLCTHAGPGVVLLRREYEGVCAFEVAPLLRWPCFLSIGAFHSARAQALYRGTLYWYLS